MENLRFPLLMRYGPETTHPKAFDIEYLWNQNVARIYACDVFVTDCAEVFFFINILFSLRHLTNSN